MNGPREVRAPSSSAESLEHARSDLALALLGRGAEDVLPSQVVFMPSRRSRRR
jgi:hypothetical protein